MAYKLVGALTALYSAAALLLPIHAGAQPASGIVTLVVPYPAGGGTDFFARTVAPRMGEFLKQTVIVENRPGASGAIAAQAVAKTMPADGNTVLLGDMGTYALNPSLFKKLSYDPQKDLLPVGMTSRFSFVLVVNPSVLPVADVKDLIKAARRSPDGLNYASPGVGTPHHLITETFKRQANIGLNPITYKGGAPAMQDVLGGQVPLMFLDLATAAPQIKSGKLRALATASEKRLAQFPDLPTISESGVPGFSGFTWQGLTVRAGTPPAAIDRIAQAYAYAVSDVGVRQKLMDAGIEPTTSTPAQFGDFIKAETVRWRGVIRENNITLD